jgi:SPX domain
LLYTLNFFSFYFFFLLLLLLNHHWNTISLVVTFLNMKFGKSYVTLLSAGIFTTSLHYNSLPRNQVPEWSPFYIDYKGLKKHLKAAVSEQRVKGEIDLARECPTCLNCCPG